MADEEAAERDRGGLLDTPTLKARLRELERRLEEGGGAGGEPPGEEAAAAYCQQLCQTLLEYAEKWKAPEDPLPLLEVYTEAIQSYIKAQPYLTSESENVALVLERLALSYVEILLCLPLELPEKKWKEIQSFIQTAHEKMMQSGSCQLQVLSDLAQENGTWKNPVLCSILSQELQDQDKGVFSSSSNGKKSVVTMASVPDFFLQLKCLFTYLSIYCIYILPFSTPKGTQDNLQIDNNSMH
ncbi:zinc finger protein 292 isoform X5 [Anolis carolinensis]|uniref:zinc finger protein 292 isoform X5 n=1 Tax=Anolis carolinensis TaxID=28377 RepID=UPI002F2B62AE